MTVLTENRDNRLMRKWILEFLEFDGLGVLLESLEKLGARGFSSVADTFSQLQCVSCLRAVMNSQVGLEYIVQHREYTRQLANILMSRNNSVKLQVFELLCALCIYSSQGHSLALDSLNYFKMSHGRRYRFDLVVHELQTADTVAYQTTLLAFVNCVILGAPDAFHRNRIRTELFGVGLESALSVLRYVEDDSLQIQLKVFDDNQAKDEEQQEPLSVCHLFDVLYKKVVNTPQVLALQSILLALSQIDPTDPKSDDVWESLQEIVTEAQSAKSPSRKTGSVRTRESATQTTGNRWAPIKRRGSCTTGVQVEPSKIAPALSLPMINHRSVDDEQSQTPIISSDPLYLNSSLEVCKYCLRKFVREESQSQTSRVSADENIPIPETNSHNLRPSFTKIRKSTPPKSFVNQTSSIIVDEPLIKSIIPTQLPPVSTSTCVNTTVLTRTLSDDLTTSIPSTPSDNMSSLHSQSVPSVASPILQYKQTSQSQAPPPPPLPDTLMSSAPSNSCTPPPPPPLPSSSVIPSFCPPPPPPMPFATPPPPPPPLPQSFISPPPPPPMPFITSTPSSQSNCSDSFQASSIPPPPPPPSPFSTSNSSSQSSCTDLHQIPPPPPPMSSPDSHMNGFSEPLIAREKVMENSFSPAAYKTTSNTYHTLPTRRLHAADLEAVYNKYNTLPKPSKKMRTLNWSKLPNQVIGKSVWANMTLPVLPIDYSQIEELFCQKPRPKSVPAQSSVDSQGPALITLLDNKRSLAVNIFLKQFKSGAPGVLEAVKNCSGLSAEKLKGLLRILPDEQEVNLIKSHPGNPSTLETAERFYAELLDVPDYTLRIQAMLQKEECPLAMSELMTQLESVISTCNCLINNNRLAEFLALLLQLGNYLNAGSYAGNAAGFKLNTLPKLLDTRANKPRMTFLHFAVDVAQTHRSDLLDFTNDLGTLRNMARNPLASLEEEVRTLSTGVRKLDKEVKVTKSKDILPKFKDFLKKTVKDVEKLEKLMVDAKSAEKRLATHFCEDPKKFQLEECFLILADFFSKIKQAIMDNEQRKKQEERTARLEAEKSSNSLEIQTRRKHKQGIFKKEDENDLLDILMKEIKIGNFKMQRTLPANTG